MDESEFLSSLDKEHHRKYKEEKKRVIRGVKEDFNRKKEFSEKKYKNGIEEDRAHRAILNACVSPFHEKGSLINLGYRFIYASPLFELGIPNFDFLLYKKKDKKNLLIVGEAKGSVSNPRAIVSEAEQRKKAFEENIDYVKRNYLHLDKDAKVVTDYVIAVPSQLSPEILNAVISNNGGFIVWHTPPAGKQILSIAFPPDKIDEPIRKTMLHKEAKLNEKIQETPTNHRAFNIFPQVHLISGLRMLITASSPGDTGLIVKEKTLKEDLENDMFYLSKDQISKKAKEIIEKGVEIGFLELEEKKGYFRIKARGQKARTLEKPLEEKWIRHKLTFESKEIEQKAIEDLQSKYIKEQKKQRKVHDF